MRVKGVKGNIHILVVVVVVVVIARVAQPLTGNMAENPSHPSQRQKI